MSVSGHSHQSRRSRNSRNSKMSGRSTLSNLHHQNQILRKDIQDIQNGLISDPFEIIDEGEEREVSTGWAHVGKIFKDSFTGKNGKCPLCSSGPLDLVGPSQLTFPFSYNLL